MNKELPQFFAQQPRPDECSAYYFSYIALVPPGNLLAMLPEQQAVTQRTLRGLADDEALFRPAPAEWSIKQVVGHLIDTERIFSYRMLRFARADTTALPGMEPDPYVAAARFDQLALADLLDEFDSVRRATTYLIAGLDEVAWQQGGTASDNFVTARALGWIIAGHELHHMISLGEKYLPG